MTERKLFHEVTLRLEQMPTVAILGPRQAGETTLALQIADRQAPNNFANRASRLLEGWLTQNFMKLISLKQPQRNLTAKVRKSRKNPLR